MRTTVCILFAALISIFTQAQPQPPLEYSFTHYSTVSGLLSNQVNAIVQDADGYIWSGTTDGLQRFDGIRYKTFRHNASDPLSIPSNPVIQLVTDKKKNLWVLLGDGRAGIFDRQAFKFYEARVKPARPMPSGTAIKKILTDEYGNVFILFGAYEVLTWDDKTLEFSAMSNFFMPKKEWDIIDFVQEPGSQRYWISTQNHGIAVYDRATDHLSDHENNTDKIPLIDKQKKGEIFFQLFFDRSRRLWYITWTPAFPIIFCYDLNTQSYFLEKAEFLTTLRTYYEIHGFLQQNDGTIWTRGQGVLARFSESEKKFRMVSNGFTSMRSISYEMVTGLFEDREKNIWVATDNNGLFRFNPAMEYFSNIQHINRYSNLKGRGSPMSFMYTKWGTVLAGTWADGLYNYDMHFNPVPVNIKGFDEKMGPSVWSMCASRDSNTIWIGAQPGVIAVNQQNRTSTLYDPPVMEHRTVRQVAEDRFGNLWMGMHGTGVYKWTAAKGKNKFDDGVAQYTAIPRTMINKITIDSKGYVWIATGMEGIYMIDPATDKVVHHFSHTAEGGQKLPEEGVSGVIEYNDTAMIITTSTYMLRYNRVSNTSTIIGTPQNISGYIAAVERDRHGYVWFATTSGLYRMNIHKKIFVKFGQMDGLDNDHFILSGSYTLPDGRMLFGTTNNFIVFDPGMVHVETSFPTLAITDFKLMNQSLRVDSLMNLKDIRLGYKDNSIVIEFSTLRYVNNHLIRYRLEGLEKDWISADNMNQVVYTHLPPGKYKFQMKMIDSEGNESEVYSPFTIKVNAPIWKTWWFYALLVLLLGILLFWYDRERMKRKAAVQDMRSDIAHKLHDDVNTALGNINILSEMARIKADKEPGKSIEFIEQIHSKSQNMMIAMDDMLWSISPENDSMEKTVLRMKEYIQALNNKNGCHIEMMADEQVNRLKLNMQFRHEALILFKDSITGLLKAGVDESRIHVGLDKNCLVYTLQFKNALCNMQQLANLLQSQEMAKRLKNIGATLNVEMHKSNSVLTMKTPI